VEIHKPVVHPGLVGLLDFVECHGAVSVQLSAAIFIHTI